MKNLIKNVVYFCRWLFARAQPGQIVILMYHSVDDKNQAFFNVEPKVFSRQMDYLSRHGYQTCTMTELINWLDGKGKLPPKTVMITFDDGYEDNFSQAYPILTKHGFSATIFLTTGLVGGTSSNSSGQNFTMLNRAQISELSRSGLIDFGAHTVSHPHLSGLSSEEQITEVSSSKILIEEMTNKPCLSFAYPYGDFNDQTVAIVREIFAVAFSVNPGLVKLGDNHLKLNRNSIDSQVSMVQFKSIIKSGRIKKKP